MDDRDDWLSRYLQAIHQASDFGCLSSALGKDRHGGLSLRVMGCERGLTIDRLAFVPTVFSLETEASAFGTRKPRTKKPLTVEPKALTACGVKAEGTKNALAFGSITLAVGNG